MAITQQEAYDILGLRPSAGLDEVQKSYKKLAIEWYPEKHGNNKLAVEKFEKISRAYKRLTSNDGVQEAPKAFSMKDMLGLFRHVFFGNGKDSLYADSDYDNSVDDSWDDDSDDADDPDIQLLSRLYYEDLLSKNALVGSKRKNTAEEASKNAEALIAEEEREKRRAEKKRTKKKRWKEKKKHEKELAKLEDKKKTENGQESSEEDRRLSIPNSPDTEEYLDPNSAFVAKAACKSKKVAVLKTRQEALKNQTFSKIDDEKQNVVGMDPKVLQSRQLAIRGNEMASIGEYQAAIDLFSEAIKLNPLDHRFIGNRSYCYNGLGLYEKALKDAEKAIAISPLWAKGYFRKGRALSGLKRYSEAEDAFAQVLRLDKECEDAVQELRNIKITQLTDMGFTQQQAEAAINNYSTVRSALEVLLPPGAMTASLDASGELFMSDDEDSWFASGRLSQARSLDKKMDPRNPEGLTSLWVGNVKSDVTDKAIRSLFAKYGEVVSTRLLPEKFCAFVNYKDKESASKAMVALQGRELCGQHLVIRFPDKPVPIGEPGVTVMRKTKPLLNQDSKQKLSGPVNGDECYFWRTTGCSYGEKCRHKHIAGHKGIDRKPWH